MKKRGYILTLLAVASAVQLTACGSKKQGAVEATEYAQVNEINNSVANACTVEGFTDTETTSDMEAKEADKDEKTESRDVAKNTDIYSKPDTKSSVVGSKEKGDTIRVFGILESGKWYKVVYGGRVAYMPAKAVKEKAEERVVTEDTVQPEETAPGVTTDPATAGTQIDASSNNNQQRDNTSNGNNSISNSNTNSSSDTKSDNGQKPSGQPTTPDNSSKADSTPSTTPTAPDTEKPDTTPTAPDTEKPDTTPAAPDTEEPSTNPDMDVEPDPNQEPATENNGNAEGTETQEATEQVKP